MEAQDWFVTATGHCQAWGPWQQENQTPEPPYRLYRFLTDVEDSLLKVTTDQQRLQAIAPLVRRLLKEADWLQTAHLEPSADTGWSVLMLYDEPDFPLTVQLVTWLPGRTSPIHNHATWGIVALLAGQEKNQFWQRTPAPNRPDQIRPAASHLLMSGDTLSLMPDAIHQVEAVGNEPTVTFNIYGETNYEQRLEFDPLTHTASLF